jgi:integrase
MTLILSDNALVPHEPSRLHEALQVLLYSLSDSSKRQYEHSLREWLRFAEARGIPPSAMTALNLIAFLEQSGLGQRSKQARLSHLRKLLETLHAADPGNVALETMVKQAKLLKIKRSQESPTKERETHALSPKQIYAAFAVWQGQNLKALRNRALLAVLVYAGLRRSEAAALKWTDIEFEQGVLTVRHGKGDKRRDIPFLSEIAGYLRDWQAVCGPRAFVFCALRKGDKLAADAPMSTKAIYEVLRETGDAIGIDFLAPHDMRRSLITNALSAGASVVDMQFVAGHSQAATTLRYAKVKDAQEVKGRVKLPY